MTNEQKRKYWSDHKIIVAHGRMSETSKCNTMRCKKSDKYMVFAGRGTMMSDLYAMSCQKHLALTVEKAIQYRNKTVEGLIKDAEEAEIQAAKQLL